jgi:hypothetical protein
MACADVYSVTSRAMRYVYDTSRGKEEKEEEDEKEI